MEVGCAAMQPARFFFQVTWSLDMTSSVRVKFSGAVVSGYARLCRFEHSANPVRLRSRRILGLLALTDII